MRQYTRKSPRPAADYETIQLSTRMLHHVMSLGTDLDPRNSTGGFLRGNGGSHVTRCGCDSCKFRRHYLRNHPRD